MELEKNYFTKIGYKINGLNRAIQRFFIKKSKNNRPDSFPYISGDGFRSLADHIYEDIVAFNPDQNVQICKFDPLVVKENDIVFVDSRSLDEFFIDFHPQIENRYILISHNSDHVVDERYIKYLDDKIIKLFAQNVAVNHPKIVPVPIGLENLYYYNNGITKYFDKFRKQIVVKKNQILFGFNLTTNPAERVKAYEGLKNSSVSDDIRYRLNNYNYLKLLNQYKFVASPPGNGIDCHRTWEAIYLNTVPIVKRSAAMDYFYSLGLPLWIIDDWQELAVVDETFLQKKYNELKDCFVYPALFMDYWDRATKDSKNNR